MAARTAELILPFPPRVIAPAVNTGNLLSRHALCPGGMRHELLRGRQGNALVLETDISKTLKGPCVSDVSPWRVSGGGVTIDEDAGNFEM